jgi:hypothetical protein
LLFSLAYAPGNCQFNIAVSSEDVVQILNDYVGQTD